jgi:hypothetical protein
MIKYNSNTKYHLQEEKKAKEEAEEAEEILSSGAF